MLQTMRLFDPFYDLEQTFRLDKPNRFDVDVYEDRESVTVLADIPGVDEKEIKIETFEGVLNIEFNRKSPETRGFLSERKFGQFKRTFRLHDILNTEGISASFKNGVLKIQIPKSEKVARRVIPIQ